MKPKTLIVVGTLTALLGGFVYFFERDLPSTDEKKELETKVLAFEADDVKSLTLRAGGGELRLEKVDATKEDADGSDDPDETADPEWRVTLPIDARADAEAIKTFLGELVGLNIERTVGDADEVDAATAGLEPPRAVVVIATADAEATLEVGADVPLSEDALVRVAGDTGAPKGVSAAGKVVQTGFGEALREKVAKEAGDWRDKRLFFARRDDVQKLSWTGPEGEHAVLGRVGTGDDFYLEQPVQDRADRDKVRGLLTSLTSLQAASFVESDEAETEASFAPQARFEATLAGRNPPWTLELADLTSDRPLARVTDESGTQLVRLETGPVIDALSGPSDTWRSSAWTHQQVFQIDEAIFDQQDQELLAIRRHESDWLRSTGDAARVSEDADGEPAGEEVPYTAASNVLYPLAEAKAERLVSETEATDLGADLSQPRLLVTLVSDDGEEALRLYGRTDEGLFAAQTDGRDIVLLLPVEEIDGLLAAVQTLRDAQPVEATAEPAEAPEPESGDGE